MKRTCIQCGQEFELTNSEIGFYKKRKLALPKRCKECREKNKKEKNDQKVSADQKTDQRMADPVQAGTLDERKTENHRSDTEKQKNKKGSVLLVAIAVILILILIGYFLL